MGFMIYIEDRTVQPSVIPQLKGDKMKRQVICSCYVPQNNILMVPHPIDTNIDALQYSIEFSTDSAVKLGRRRETTVCT